MNSIIRSRSNNRRQFIADVCIFALVVAFPFRLRLPFGAIVVSGKYIHIQGVCIMIWLNVEERRPEGIYKVV